MQAEEEMIMIKGKRSKRPRPSSPFALTMDTTSSSTTDLNSGGDGFGFGFGGITSDLSGSTDHRTSSPESNSGEVLMISSIRSTDHHEEEEGEEEDLANCLILLAKGRDQKPSLPVAAAVNKGAAAVEVYQCKTCNKSFQSFQALGGHRASHKKPNFKPTLTLEEKEKLPKKPSKEIKQENLFQSKREENNTTLSLQIPSRMSSSSDNKSRVHECSICGAEFASGQALGGHMRRHRPIVPPVATSSIHQEVKKPRNMLSLDLNLPAPDDDHRESKFAFGPKEQVIVFSASPLVDCHY